MKYYHRKKSEGPLEKVLIGYKIEGHETWRFEVKATLKEFEQNWNATFHPKITDLKTWKLDRLTGIMESYN